MIDLRRLRDDADYRGGIERKRVAPGLLTEVISADADARAQRTAVEELRAQQKAISNQIGSAAPDARDARRTEATEVKERVKAAEETLAVVERRLHSAAELNRVQTAR